MIVNARSGNFSVERVFVGERSEEIYKNAKGNEYSSLAGISTIPARRNPDIKNRQSKDAYKASTKGQCACKKYIYIGGYPLRQSN